jgi:hypothetical protein
MPRFGPCSKHGDGPRVEHDRGEVMSELGKRRLRVRAPRLEVEHRPIAFVDQHLYC